MCATLALLAWACGGVSADSLFAPGGSIGDCAPESAACADTIGDGSAMAAANEAPAALEGDAPVDPTPPRASEATPPGMFVAPAPSDPELGGSAAGEGEGPDAMSAGEAAEEAEVTPPDELLPCEPGPFGAPERVVGIDLASALWAPQLAADGRALLFAVSQESEDIFIASRAPEQPGVFFDVRELGGVNSPDAEGAPFLSRDGLRLYFYSTRTSAGGGGRDLWMASRASTQDEFADLQPLSELNTPDEEHLPWLSEDEQTILFVSTRAAERGSYNLLQATRAEGTGPFGAPELVANVNSDTIDGRGALSGDALTLVLSTDRPGGLGSDDLWFAQRATRQEAFGEPTPLTAVNSDASDIDAALSVDGMELFFSSSRGGQPELWRSARAACAP